MSISLISNIITCNCISIIFQLRMSLLYIKNLYHFNSNAFWFWHFSGSALLHFRDAIGFTVSWPVSLKLLGFLLSNLLRVVYLGSGTLNLFGVIFWAILPFYLYVLSVGWVGDRFFYLSVSDRSNTLQLWRL